MTSPSTEPGGLTWVVVSDEDADLAAGPTGATVVLGPLNAPVARPHWWAPVESPMGTPFTLPHEAGGATAELAVNGSRLRGSVRLTATDLHGRPSSYEAVIDAHAADAVVLERSELLPPAPDLFGRVVELQARVHGHFQRGDLPALLAGLRESVALRRELSTGELMTGPWERTLAGIQDMLTLDRHLLDLIATSGRLGELLGQGAAALTAAAATLARLDRTPPDPERFDQEVTTARTELAALTARLRALIPPVLQTDLRVLPDGHPLRTDREELLARLTAGAEPDELDTRETAWEHALADHPERSQAIAVKNAAVALTAAAARMAHQHAFLERLDPAGNARRLWARNAEGIALLAVFVESWRSRLTGDSSRIDLMEQALPLHGQLVEAMADLGAPVDALVAAEMSRARAFADLMTGRSTARTAAPRLTTARLTALLGEYGRPLVEYFLTGDRLLVFVAAPDGTVEAADLRVDRAHLQALTDELQGWFRVTSGDEDARMVDEARVTELLRALGAILWDPIAGLLPADPDIPVTLVPHDDLLRLPFHALLDGDGRHLVARHATTVLPAAAILPPLLARAAAYERERPSRICALVDPEPMPDDFTPLPTLRAGFGVVSGLFAEAEIYRGAEATVDALRAGAARRPSVLCLATHAQALPGDPMASFVALASGKLRADAVPELELPVPLVVLAACETGAGRVTADGIVGLSRAFLSAGPVGVLMTLWPVVERASLRLLRRFHELRLGTPRGNAQALRAAQLSLVESGVSPTRWAAFTLFGLPD
ncbi:CHAT domain-containing protein [Acrocarpospora catenulata]|uniref:CHAT domain-containing protein n=1 Tax=Acrocarpospora catenulata TaxID=2836182 RepID=UPI001BDA5D7D|nr:CHAT domain-containing protein [Acrocarpospora catenulata]